MASKHQKKLLAVEWTWLVTGSAVVLAFTVEAWAAPHVPVLWMLGMLALLFAYRFALTLYEINWPEPDLTAAEAAEEMRRQGGDGISGTVVYALPQMRGRSVPQERDKKRVEEAARLELPSADGVFEDDNLDTVFGIVAEDTSPTPVLDGMQRPPAKVVGRPGLFGVTVYEHEALRPETEADMTSTDMPIPGFAESQLTSLEREKALKHQMEAARPRKLSAAVAAVVNRSAAEQQDAKKDEKKPGLFGLDILKNEDAPARAKKPAASSGPLNAKKRIPRPKSPAPALMPDEQTYVDRPVNLSEVTRDVTRLDQKILDRKKLKKMPLDEMKLDEMQFDEMQFDEMQLETATDDEINLEDLLFEDELLLLDDEPLDDEKNLAEETRLSQTPSALKGHGTSNKESP